MIHCSYCYAEIPKPSPALLCGPKLVFCDRKCYAFSGFKKYPGSPHNEALRQMYPEWAAEFDRLEDKP